MKRIFLSAAIALSLLASGALLAQSTAPSAPAATQPNVRTAKLKVEGLWCASCGYIVSRALTRAPGVIDAKVSMRAKTAVVTFDSSKTNLAALVAVTSQYGFPSRVIAD